MRSEKFTSTHAAQVFVFVFLAVSCAASVRAENERTFSAIDLDRIAHRIWKNECAGTVDGLTSWNTSENFASLGIGHFIWYPAGGEGPFEESFPKLKRWLQGENVALPKWLLDTAHCPWADRAAFQRAHDSVEQKDLRKLLSATLPQQTRYIIHRLHEAVPKYRSAAGKASERVEQNITLLNRTVAGSFAMIDYVNFKGEGLNPKERYNGEGWGLLQVLMEMETSDGISPEQRFAEAAQRVLTRRVKNSPPARNEKQWLGGWKSRCDDYRK